MVELINVYKSYNGTEFAVEGLNLKIMDGEIFGFLGPNGAGKTTTLKMLTGIAKPDKGEINIKGINLKTHPIEAKKQFGYVPDNHEFFLRVKGIEYLNFMADIYEVSSSERKKIIQDLSVRFEMDNHLHQQMKSYSHGMKQKISIIGAMIHSPKLLILDEPMTGLDPKATHELKKIMKEYANDGRSVFFSTHVLEVAENICDKVAILNKGKMLFTGTVDEMKLRFNVNESLEQMFLEITK